MFFRPRVHDKTGKGRAVSPSETGLHQQLRPPTRMQSHLFPVRDWSMLRELAAQRVALSLNDSWLCLNLQAGKNRKGKFEEYAPAAQAVTRLQLKGASIYYLTAWRRLR